MRTVAHQASMGRLRQEQLEQTIAPSPDRDQVQHLPDQLAHRKAQLEHVRSERDTHFVHDEELLAHMRLFSSDAKDWNSRVISEAEQALVRESAEAARKTTEAQEATDKKLQARWREAEDQLRDMHESNNAQVQQLAESLQQNELEHQHLHTASERDACKLEAKALRMSQDTQHQALSMVHQVEEEVQRLRDHTGAQPDHLKAQWKKQVCQAATYKAETHALHTDLPEKSELQATLSAKMISVDTSRPSAESEPEVLLSTILPCGSPWILPSQNEHTNETYYRRRTNSHMGTGIIWPT